MDQQITLAQWLEQCVAGTPPGNWFVTENNEVEWEKRQTFSHFTIYKFAPQRRIVGAYMMSSYDEEKANRLVQRHFDTTDKPKDIWGTTLTRTEEEDA